MDKFDIKDFLSDIEFLEYGEHVPNSFRVTKEKVASELDKALYGIATVKAGSYYIRNLMYHLLRKEHEVTVVCDGWTNIKEDLNRISKKLTPWHYKNLTIYENYDSIVDAVYSEYSIAEKFYGAVFIDVGVSPIAQKIRNKCAFSIKTNPNLFFLI